MLANSYFFSVRFIVLSYTVCVPNPFPPQIAWALNKGIKPAHKKFWDVEQGVTYLPWGKVKVEELESYREGGMLDPETLNPGKHELLLA